MPTPFSDDAGKRYALHLKLDIGFRLIYRYGRTKIVNHQVPQGIIGNPVRTGDGPAAVNGDEIRESHCFAGAKREGSESRLIRESEDLPDDQWVVGTWNYAMARRRTK